MNLAYEYEDTESQMYPMDLGKWGAKCMKNSTLRLQ